MFKEGLTFGIIFVTGKMYSLHRMTKSGDHIENKKLIDHDVDLPNKHKKGGQSQLRFSRLHDEKENVYIKKLGELVIKYYVNSNTKYEKIIIAGSGDKKNLLANDELVQQYFKGKIIIQNTNDLNDQTINKNLTECYKYFDIDADTKNNNMITKIQNLLATDPDKLVFGTDDILNCLVNNELEMLITTEEIFSELDKSIINNCKVFTMPKSKLDELGIDLVGIKWY